MKHNCDAETLPSLRKRGKSLSDRKKKKIMEARLNLTQTQT